MTLDDRNYESAVRTYLEAHGPSTLDEIPVSSPPSKATMFNNDIDTMSLYSTGPDVEYYGQLDARAVYYLMDRHTLGQAAFVFFESNLDFLEVTERLRPLLGTFSARFTPTEVDVITEALRRTVVRHDITFTDDGATVREN